jgi:hypothetical protein
VLKSSVYIRLAELEEFDRLSAPRQDATSRDLTQVVAQEPQREFANDNSRQATSPDVSHPAVVQQESHATTIDTIRPAATSRDLSRDDETVEQKNVPPLSERERELYDQIVETYKDQIVELQNDKKLLQDDKKMLMEQLISKDRQIDHFFSSERDTKKLFGSLQNIMTFLWPGSKRSEPSEALPQSFAPVVRDVPDGLDEDNRQGS